MQAGVVAALGQAVQREQVVLVVVLMEQQQAQHLQQHQLILVEAAAVLDLQIHRGHFNLEAMAALALSSYVT
jgi:hypothetical protein